MPPIRYSRVVGKSKSYFMFLFSLCALALSGLVAAHFMDTNGHHVTGMTNRVVWGLPHVFAIFLIVGASGCLNIASIGTVFGRQDYKPLGRLSALVSIALLIGGLCVLVLDLGRPDRLIIAMTHFNFKSIFAWNILLYVGFLLIVVVYLWFMMEPRMKIYSRKVGVFAFVWRFILTTGTGSIFGFLVARKSYDTAILAPLFIVLSLVIGSAIFILAHSAIMRFGERPLRVPLISKICKLLALFLCLLFYMTLVQHLSFSYATERHGVEKFILAEGGIYTFLFWGVQILIGTLLPLIVFLVPYFNRLSFLLMGCCMVLLGGFAQLYVIIIGGQAYPLEIFPGYIVEDGFFSHSIAAYVPTIPELFLGVGGIALVVILVMMVIRILPFVEESSSSSVH